MTRRVRGVVRAERHRPRARAVGGLTAACALLAGCAANPEREQPAEVYPQVEFRYDQAIRRSLAEVPGSRLLDTVLRDPRSAEPVWRSEVATPDGTVHAVRVDASGGRLKDTQVPPGQDGARRADVTARLAGAKILPEDAAREVTRPEYGKVTDVALREDRAAGGRTFWYVTVTERPRGQEDVDSAVYKVDAATGDVADRSSVAPVS
ncbi:hypothetical protein ACFY93_28650 [Streptomyces sp. NPDC008313]|uniref:hypothetical protein n=1 Tax=Streptomyces sp. NPDC008313 TaxID=3364826 RepID=UPI0036E3E597